MFKLGSQMRTRERNIQLTLILVGIVLFVLTYLLYPNFKKQTLTNKQFIEEKKDEVAVGKESTSFEKVIYHSDLFTQYSCLTLT